jgi:Spy/CpxP family protein refolding chaperone
MKQIINKFRYGIMAGAIALTIPLAASSAPCNCQDVDHPDLKQPEVLSMHNEMMSMRQGILPTPPVGMMPPPPFSFGEKPLLPFLLGLDLTESQLDKIFELLHSQEPAMRAQGKVIRKARAEINRLAAADHYNAAEVQRQADKLAGAIADSVVLRTETDAGIYVLLTPEQRKHADEARARLEAELAHQWHPPQ